VARYHWVALQRFNAVSERELKTLLRNAYDLVFEKLPKKTKASLDGRVDARKAGKNA